MAHALKLRLLTLLCTALPAAPLRAEVVIDGTSAALHTFSNGDAHADGTGFSTYYPRGGSGSYALEMSAEGRWHLGADIALGAAIDTSIGHSSTKVDPDTEAGIGSVFVEGRGFRVEYGNFDDAYGVSHIREIGPLSAPDYTSPTGGEPGRSWQAFGVPQLDNLGWFDQRLAVSYSAQGVTGTVGIDPFEDDAENFVDYALRYDGTLPGGTWRVGYYGFTADVVDSWDARWGAGTYRSHHLEAGLERGPWSVVAAYALHFDTDDGILYGGVAKGNPVIQLAASYDVNDRVEVFGRAHHKIEHYESTSFGGITDLALQVGGSYAVADTLRLTGTLWTWQRESFDGSTISNVDGTDGEGLDHIALTLGAEFDF